MNSQEFQTWIENHQKLIPSFASWLQGVEDRQLMCDEWEATLSRCSLDSCQDATRAIVSGDMDKPWPDMTAAAVRAWALQRDSEERQSVRKKTSHNPLVCELCGNTGLASVWHPLLVRAIRENCDKYKSKRGEIVQVITKDGRPRFKTAAKPCKCSLGEQYETSYKIHGKQKAEIDNGRFGDSPNDVAIVSCDWVDDICNARPQNYEASFDEF